MSTQSRISISSPPVLPDDVWCSWLAQYRSWVEPTTDGALEAIFAGSSIELSLAIGRNVAVYYGRRTYPNLYVATVGPTGVHRKSTIQSRRHDIRPKVFLLDAIRVSRSIGSGEGLLELFCKEEKEGKRVVLNPIPGQRVLLDEPELTNLLKKARRPGTANIVEILLALYDGDDWSPNTRNRPIRVREPFFCLLTASTPESLEMTLEDIDIDSGLIPRFASFWCTPREPIAYPPPPDEGLLNRIVEEFQDITRYGAEIGASQGALNLSHEARKEWESAYRDFTMESRKAPKAVAAIMTRVPTQVMKWSLLYAIQASHANIEMDDLARGILVGTYLMETARLIPGYVSKAQVARVEQKIIESLTRVRGKWLTASSIHHLVSGRVKASELRGSLRALVELEVIEEGTSESGKANIYRVS